MLHVEGAEVRRVREQLGEDQTTFGARWGKHRRTVIRWEQKGTRFNSWLPWRASQLTMPGVEPSKSDAEIWESALRLAERRAKSPLSEKGRKSNGASAKDGATPPAVGRSKARAAVRGKGRVRKSRKRPNPARARRAGRGSPGGRK